MKTTLDIPDTLYRKVKAKAAGEGRTVRDVTIELYREWLGASKEREPFDREAWLASWLELSERISKAVPPGQDLRSAIDESRNRLEPE